MRRNSRISSNAGSKNRNAEALDCEGFMRGMNFEFLSREEVLGLGFKSVGEEVLIHKTVVLVHCERVSLGHRVRVGPFSVLSASVAQISVGSHVHIASHCSFTAQAEIILEDFSEIAQGARLITSTDDYSGLGLSGPTVPDEYRKLFTAPIRIRRHCAVGTSSTIMPGVTIGEGTVVGALSLVKESLPEWSIYAGVPARRIRDRRRDVLDLEAKLKN